VILLLSGDPENVRALVESMPATREFLILQISREETRLPRGSPTRSRAAPALRRQHRRSGDRHHPGPPDRRPHVRDKGQSDRAG
jgi:hypothetical protein